MKKISLKSGRVNQKLQTRALILEAANTLMKGKKNISLELVAAKANVSRATIYRYFPKVELLITEASLDIYYESPDKLIEKTEDMSLHARIAFIQQYYNKLAIDHELAFRRYLSAVLKESITSKRKVRGARRYEAMKKVLQPYEKEFSKQNLENLSCIAVILMGIDPVIVAKDVCGLSSKQSDEVLRWGLDMILKGVVSKNLS